MNSIKDPNSRIWKWKLKLSDYEFEINYKKGESNLNAGALSRNPPEVCLPIRAREEEDPPEGEPPQKKNLRSISTEDFKGPMTRSRHLAFRNRELKYLEFPKRRRKRIPIPEELKDEDMEQNTLSSETSRNKEQKRKRTLSSDLSIAAPSPKRKIQEKPIDIAGTSQEEEESIETTETLQEKESIETTGTLQEEESMETTETPQDEESMEIIDISPSPPQLSPRTTTSRSEDTIPHQNQLVIRESRDSLAKIKDNKVIFIGLDGSPIDKGGKELETENLLPNHVDLTLERARPVPDGVRYIISLPIKENPRTVIRPDNILNGLMSLWDVITEFDLKSFAISRTHNIEDIPWKYIINRLKHIFEELPITITICTGEVVTPPENLREHIIKEKHTSSSGGHKGVTKTYHRIRQNYYWENMKKEIQKFIRECQDCQMKKGNKNKNKTTNGLDRHSRKSIRQNQHGHRRTIAKNQKRKNTYTNCLRFGSSDLRHTQLTAAPPGQRSDKPDPQSIGQSAVSDRTLSQSLFRTSLDPPDSWRRRSTEVDRPYCSSILFTQSTKVDASVSLNVFSRNS